MGSGYVLVVLMFLVNMVTSLLFNFSYWLFQIIGMHLKTNLIAAVYRKVSKGHIIMWAKKM